MGSTDVIAGLTGRRIDWLAYFAVLLLVGRQALTYAGWAVIDVAVRLEIWPPALIRFDVYEYYSQITWLHELVFVLALVSFLAAFAAVILRSRYALHLLIFCLLPGISDWVMMTTVPQLLNDMSGYLHLIGHLVAICGLIFLRIRGFLR